MIVSFAPGGVSGAKRFLCVRCDAVAMTVTVGAADSLAAVATSAPMGPPPLCTHSVSLIGPSEGLPCHSFLGSSVCLVILWCVFFTK